MIPYSTQYIEDDDLQAVLSALKQEYITQGSLVGAFEQKIANFVGAKYAITFNSATSALNVAYKIINSLDLPKLKEFITTPITFCATSNMMLENQIKPIFCEINSIGNIDTKSITKHITNKTRAIVSIDYAGNSVDIDEILKICKENKLYFISDSSHSFSGEYKGKRIGQFADMSIFSFHALKPITTIEGGAITTNNKSFYDKAKLLRSHGVKKKKLWDSDIENIGYNFRLSDVASSLGISQLNKVESFLKKRRMIAKIYNNAFKNNDKFSILEIPKHIKSTYHLYPILLDKSLFKYKKKIFLKLQSMGLGVQVHYKPIYQFSLYKDYSNIKNADDFYNAEISIPCHQKMQDSDIEYVIDSIFKTLKDY
ncbi:UDP-4-amino-4,6-dideoxy-N-acetyl-beta-L-altrosamine transaminase [Helicobacter sp. MIT 14-3879]|uniref:UDP-4-amino-4, 6-dideoxy-N-acetyl-beta-L-altrosamine transaminase n=1 Tax=Helicobacter sp. MIT 14-3879 TaxID=2040649 RepID=UPI000E1E33E5|nr:UDP-4-amino-4,6-dideoxy-N-acetyl-beta-L-altrosamine transaminase [Helicobacter sp. MIT 14-3879]RDU65212.1 UDP-4-amino-4,6-dideoxy-N-acetyl-beta-L-altrosamine transaminase [Helicobacter sp. MIT 14-3879]